MHKFASIQDQGKRAEMEDFLDYLDNPRGSGVFYAGVFDGHNGDRTASLCQEKLKLYFLDALFSAEPRDAGKAFAEAYRRLGGELVEEVSGSCAATLALDGRELTVANVGDCRIIVVGRDDYRQLTVDHTPKNPAERKRIFECAGPEKLHQDASGLRLVDDMGEGLLQPSRSFGDVRFRRSGLSYAPAIAGYRLNEDDLYVIAATDGLSGAVTNKEAAKIARRMTQLDDIPKALAFEAYQNDATDNITILAVDVRN